MRIEELLYRMKDEKKIAIEQEEKAITYEDWYIKATEVENILKQLGAEGNNVAIFMPNSIHYAIAYFGIIFSNNIVVPIFSKAVSDEVIRVLDYCECDILLTTTAHFGKIKDLYKVRNYILKIVYLDTGEIEVLNENRPLITKTGYIRNNGTDKDVVLLLHTSGTTSEPKRVMLTHYNLINNIEANILSLHLSEQDVGLIALPMGFGYCNTAQFLSYLYVGAKFVIMPSLFHPTIFFNIVETKRITNFTAVPTMLHMILKFGGTKDYDYSSMRFICFGGGFISFELLQKIISRFPEIDFIQTYGQTECSPRVTALLPPYTISKMGSVGRPIPGVDIKVKADNGIEYDRDAVGEIIVRGNNIMQGYYKNPNATKQVIVDGGIRTGDVGYIDKDGFLYLKGRNKNIIISGGINIYPEEVEEVIKEFEGIENVCVRGVPDEEMGELPIAEVIKNCQNIKEADIIAYCRKRLSYYKVPKKIEFVDQLQTTYNGKIKR